MVDLAQADSTLRTKAHTFQYYYVRENDGTIHGSFDSHADAIRFALKDIDNRQVITGNQ